MGTSPGSGPKRASYGNGGVTRKLFAQFNTFEVNVPLHAVGCQFYKTSGGEVTEVFLSKHWKIRTTHKILHARLTKYQEIKLPTGCVTQQVRGNLGKKSAIYPRQFTQQIWKAICEECKSAAQIKEEMGDDFAQQIP